MKFKKSHCGMKAMNLQCVGRCEKSAIVVFSEPKCGWIWRSFLMRPLQELFEQAEFVHQLQSRRMYGVATKIAQEILVLFQNDHFHADASEQKARASFPPVRRRQRNSVSVVVRQFEGAGS